MSDFQKIIDAVPFIEEQIGYSFHERSLLVQAFIHRSYINENKDVTDHNERLEFLGDSVLGVLISEYLYKKMPDTQEGDLSSFRSRLVEANSCILYVRKLNIDQYILLGKGERIGSTRGRDTILADFFEALIGAIYLDGGLEVVKQFLFKHFELEFATILDKPSNNWKAILQDFCQRKYQSTPVYRVLHEEGPDHNKKFQIGVFCDELSLGNGEGPSKKEAQQAAAADALSKIKL